MQPTYHHEIYVVLVSPRTHQLGHKATTLLRSPPQDLKLELGAFERSSALGQPVLRHDFDGDRLPGFLRACAIDKTKCSRVYMVLDGEGVPLVPDG